MEWYVDTVIKCIIAHATTNRMILFCLIAANGCGMFLIFQAFCRYMKIKKHPDWRNDDDFLCDLYDSIYFDIAFVVGYLFGFFNEYLLSFLN